MFTNYSITDQNDGAPFLLRVFLSYPLDIFGNNPIDLYHHDYLKNLRQTSQFRVQRQSGNRGQDFIREKFVWSILFIKNFRHLD